MHEPVNGHAPSCTMSISDSEGFGKHLDFFYTYWQNYQYHLPSRFVMLSNARKVGFFFRITTKIILQQHLNHVSIWLPTTAVMKFTVSHSRKISQPHYYTTLWQSPGVIISVKVVEINCREGLTCLPKGVLPKSCSALILLLHGWHAWLQINFNPIQEVLKRIWKSIPSCKIFKASCILPHYLLRAPKIMRCSLKPFV